MLRSLTRKSSVLTTRCSQTLGLPFNQGESFALTCLRSLSLAAPLPSNLKIDAKSSFAPRKIAADDKPRRIFDQDENAVDDEEEEPFFPAEHEVVYEIPLPDRLHVKVYTLFAPEYDAEVGTFWLNENVFGKDPIRIDLMKQYVEYYRAKKRGVRKAKTKTISEVSGSGRKIRPQKGTGQARAGHSRPPHFRGGAKAHGPKNVTDYGNRKLNKKVRKRALTHALSQKLKEGGLIVMDQFHQLATYKTKDLARLLETWGIGGKKGTSALILDHYVADNDDESQPKSFRKVPLNLRVASSNIPKITVGNDHKANVYDILKHDKLILSLAAIHELESRLKDI